MTALPTTILPRVSALVRLLGSPVDGERLGACRALERTLASSGATLHDLAERIERGPAPRGVYADEPDTTTTYKSWQPWSERDSVRCSLQIAVSLGGLTTWEREFSKSVLAQITASWTWRPSPKQRQQIEVIVEKSKVRARASQAKAARA